MSAVFHWHSRSPEQTRRLGREVGRLLQAGDLVALSGPLGAGKTQFVKGIANGLGVPESEPVLSPTFVLVREYAGRLRLYHMDAYRLSGTEDLLALGLEEMLEEPETAIVIEWAERVAQALPAESWWIELSHAGELERELTIRIPGERIREFQVDISGGRADTLRELE